MAMAPIEMLDGERGATPALRWEPCDVFRIDAGCGFATCLRCGWPCDDHESHAGTGDALVIHVDRRHPPLRRAS